MSDLRSSFPAEEPPSGPRRSRNRRVPVNVDDVGAAAVAMAAKAVRRSVPQLLNSRRELKCEPLEPRDAFILSLVDGHMDMLAIIDVSGMPPGTVLPILARLAELGLVALP